jgi:hypothetical protein
VVLLLGTTEDQANKVSLEIATFVLLGVHAYLISWSSTLAAERNLMMETIVVPKDFRQLILPPPSYDEKSDTSQQRAYGNGNLGPLKHPAKLPSFHKSSSNDNSPLNRGSISTGGQTTAPSIASRDATVTSNNSILPRLILPQHRLAGGNDPLVKAKPLRYSHSGCSTGQIWDLKSFDHHGQQQGSKNLNMRKEIHNSRLNVQS